MLFSKFWQLDNNGFASWLSIKKESLLYLAIGSFTSKFSDSLPIYWHKNLGPDLDESTSKKVPNVSSAVLACEDKSIVPLSFNFPPQKLIYDGSGKN